MKASSTSPTPPEQHLFSQPVRLTRELQKPGGAARYYKKRAIIRQELAELTQKATSKQECTKGAELLATNLRKFHKI